MYSGSFKAGLFASVLVLLVLTISTSSCSGSDPTSAPSVTNPGVQAASELSNRQLWGYWTGYVPPSGDAIEFVPVRSSQFHMNARRFLEDTACKNCLKLVKVEKDFVNMVIKADIEITHPFAGADRFTGFDVRGIVISNGSRNFPTLGVTVPDAAMGDFTLKNPDGYTGMWNSVDFPPGSGPFPILEYSKGKFAAEGSFTGTVNPFIKFSQDPRDCFHAGASITKTFELTLIPGGAIFGYAVDASWEAPTIDPPVDLMTDFPESANALEPYILTCYQMEPLKDFAGSTGIMNVDMADRQNGSWYTSTLLEAPDLWKGTIEPDIWGGTTGEPLWYPFSTFFTTKNDLAAPEGSYPALFRIIDDQADPWLGYVNASYAVAWITVIHEEPPEMSGKAVFIAPGAPDDPNTPNVFLLDVETKEETQLTDFQGVGAIFEEPRINPAGTHMLLTFCPTPFASHVDVYEIGVTSWTASPSGVYDGDADFHPDGEHILVASGTQFDNTPDLYSMKYNGSERTLIATAPGSVRNPRWSPDGSRIVMEIQSAGAPPPSMLWMYDVKTGQFAQMTWETGTYQHPSWSPVQVEGRYLIACDFNMGDPTFMNDIVVFDADAYGIMNWIDTGWNETHPSFSPDGLSLIYSASDGSDEELNVYVIPNQMVVPITSDDTFDFSPSWCWGW